jgi:hypothetical protein
MSSRKRRLKTQRMIVGTEILTLILSRWEKEWPQEYFLAPDQRLV